MSRGNYFAVSEKVTGPHFSNISSKIFSLFLCKWSWSHGTDLLQKYGQLLQHLQTFNNKKEKKKSNTATEFYSWRALKWVMACPYSLRFSWWKLFYFNVKSQNRYWFSIGHLQQISNSALPLDRHRYLIISVSMHSL